MKFQNDSHAQLKTMKKKIVKFQNDSWKNVVAHTRYILKRSSDAEKITMFASRKSGEQFSTITPE